MKDSKPDNEQHSLLVRRLGIDTYREPIIYMREDCHICRSEGFEARSRIKVTIGERSAVATLNIVRDSLLQPGELGLSDAAWRLLQPVESDRAFLSHPEPDPW